MEGTGEVHRVSGPVVTATGIAPKMYDLVFVGDSITAGGGYPPGGSYPMDDPTYRYYLQLLLTDPAGPASWHAPRA